MSRASPRPLATPYGVIASPEDARRVSEAIAAGMRRLSGRARLAQAAALEELCIAIDLHIGTMEAKLMQMRANLSQLQRSSSVCAAYAAANKKR